MVVHVEIYAALRLQRESILIADKYFHCDNITHFRQDLNEYFEQCGFNQNVFYVVIDDAYMADVGLPF